jgi:hypothetical protein
MFEGATAPQHDDFGARPRGNVSELKCYVPGTNETNARRKRRKVEKVRAGFDKLLARYPERSGASPARNHEKLCCQLLPIDNELIGTAESAKPVISRDPQFLECSFSPLGDRVSE